MYVSIKTLFLYLNFKVTILNFVSFSESHKTMDELDKQLAELALLNKTDLKIHPASSQQNTLTKKIGPAVPPKPKKQPLVNARLNLIFKKSLR